MGAKETVEKIFQLDTEIASLKEAFETFSIEERTGLLADMFSKTIAAIKEADHVSLELVRIIELMSSMDTAPLAKLLGSGLAHDNDEVRLLCVEALLQIGSEDAEALVPAIDDAVKNGGLQAEEMLHILGDLSDEGLSAQVERFLKSDDVELAALAIELIVEAGDVSAIPSIKELVDDKRVISIEGESPDGNVEWTLGQMARDAVEMLENEEN